MTCLNLNLIKQAGRHNSSYNLSQRIIYPEFCQKLWKSCFPASFYLELHQVWLNWEQIAFDWKSSMLWIWTCPVITKELFLKIAVPKRQTKCLKTTCEVVSFCYIYKLYTWNLLKTILSQAFLKGFAKIASDVPLYGIVKYLIIYSAEVFQCFFHS